MPNDNLGVAHGSIRLDLDDRASRKLLLVLEKMSRQFDAMQKQMIKIDRTLKSADRSFEDTGRSMDRATKASKGLAGGVFAANKSISRLSRDSKELYDNLNKLAAVMERANDWYKPIKTAYITLDIFSRSVISGTGKMRAFNDALGKSGVYASFRKNIFSTIVDMKGAMRDLPTWTQNLNRMAVKMAQLGAAGLVVGKIAQNNFIGKAFNTAQIEKYLAALARTSVFQKFALSNEKMASRVANAFDMIRAKVPGMARDLDHNFNIVSRSFNRGFKPILEFAQGAKGFIAGAALVRSGINGILAKFEWLRRIPTPILRGLAMSISVALPAALSVFSKALSATSNVLLGLLDGVKQLSGAVLVLPGLFASLGAVGATLAAVFTGLKDKFKDVFSDDYTKSWEALWKLPEHLRPMALALKNAKKPLVEMQVALQKIAFSGIEKQIDALANNYIPQMQRAMSPLVKSLRGAKDELLAFAGASSTRSDINAIFDNTASTVGRLSKAIAPALAGFRDIAVVGTQFINNLSSSVPGLVDKFAQWASVNRENGKLLGWMQDAREGAVDLVKGLGNLTQALWTMLTVFRTNTGTGFLDGFATSMERFNQAVQRSSTAGLLRDIGNAVRDWTRTDKVNEFTDAFKSFADMLSSVWKVVQGTAEAFTAQFLPALKQIMAIVEIAADIKHALGLDEILGTVLGLVAAFKLGDSALHALFSTGKAVAGAFMLFKNASKVVSGIETAALATATALQKMGRMGKVAGDSLLNVTSGVRTIGAGLAATATAVGGIAIAVAAGWFAWEAANKRIAQGLDAINERNDQIREFGDDLQRAFGDDKGLTGGSVITVINGQLDDLMSNLEHRAEAMPTLMDHIGSAIGRGFDPKNLFGDGGGWMPQDTDAINSLQEMANKAQLAQAAFHEAGVTSKELQAAISGSDGAFREMEDRLLNTSNGGAEASAEISRLRKEFQQAAQYARDLGTGGAQVEAGLRKIAEAGGDATTKLEGFRDVLTGLGILKTDALDAAAAYEKAIDDLATGVQEALSKGGGLDDLINKQTGSFNIGTEAGRGFYDTMKELGNTFMTNVSAGANAQTEYAKFTDQLDTLSQQTGISKDKLIELGRSVGLVPKALEIAVSVEGKPEAVRDLANVLITMQENVGKGIEVPVGIDTNATDISNKINSILGPGMTRAEGTNLYIKPGIAPADVEKLQSELAKLGIGPNAQPQEVQIGTGLGKTGQESDAALEQQKSKIDEFLGTISDGINKSTDEAKDSGNEFAQQFAAGMLSGKDVVGRASDALALEARERFHHSPPKKGPLSDHGDAARYAGEMFSTVYASGMASRTGEVAGAAGGLGRAAVGGVSAAGSSAGLKGDKQYETGKFLGQISQISEFAEHFVGAMSKLAQTVLAFAKFASDPLQKGTFFGSSPKFRRDPTISDADLTKQRADAAQQRAFSFYGSAQRPDLYDPATGNLKARDPGKLAPGADQQATANYIIDKAMSLGYSRQQANEFATQAFGESAFSATASNPAGWEGIFQFDVPTWESAGGGDVRNAQQNIDNYFNLASQRGLTPQNFKDPHQLGTQVSIGGPLNPSNVGHEARARAGVKQFLDNYQAGAGQLDTGILPGVPAAVGNLPASTKLKTGPGLEPNAAALARVLEAQFPGITQIGGQRPDSKFAHPAGRAIDVGVGSGQSAAELGDRINAWVQANAAQFGVQSTIWRDKGVNLVANEGGGPGTTYPAAGHGGPSGTESTAHVHVQFAKGGHLDISPDGTMNFNVPSNSPLANANYGIPKPPEDTGTTAPRKDVVRNPDGTFSVVHGDAAGAPPGDNPINALTGLPWTDAETTEFWNRPENAQRFDQNILQGGEDAPGIFQGTQDDMLKELQAQTPLLAQANELAMGKGSEKQAVETADALQSLIDQQTAIDTPESRAKAQTLQGIQSSITSEYGLSQEENPIDKAAGVVSSISGVAGEVFKAINSGIEAIGATKDIADTLVRYPSNTEDIYRMIDDFQKYIELAASIAGATSSIMGAAGSFTGGMDMGAVQGASQIAAMVQAALETVNAMIDLGQEAYRIVGSYFGDFLGYLVGGADSLRGNVKFLLDEQTNQLLAYSQDNPLDKRSHAGIGGIQNPESRNQLMGDVYVYGGPGRDPRDDTRQMMYQVRASQMASATGQ